MELGGIRDVGRGEGFLEIGTIGRVETTRRGSIYRALAGDG